MNKHYYNVNITYTSDRKGTMCSPELTNKATNTTNCIEVATPPEFPKGMPHIWTPEHLFTAAVSSCLMTTFLAIAENSKLEFISFSCESKGILDKVDGKFVMSEIILLPKLIIADQAQHDRALRIVEKAEKVCLISNSINSKISMDVTITVKS